MKTGEEEKMLCKKKLRRNASLLRGRISPTERTQLSRCIAESFIRQPFFVDKNIFFVYCSYLTEVETYFLMDLCLRAGKTLAVPLTAKETATGQFNMCAVAITDPLSELTPGHRGIPEPILPDSAITNKRKLDAKHIEVVALPGLAFDRHGNRLGYGGGCYDRFLARQAPEAIRVGLAFSCQLVDALPVESHDVPLHFLLTENETLSW